ncbi:hypothetical protein OH807_23360 [Kitasatospora sp. NBC_01560]|uniref:hypothetical protein n=1 Tax=Kitasatospora sp. NBC_01560 TaxID=2975965 RepID=UPI003864E993
MRSEDAVEIVRAALALALPTASAEGLTRAAETVIRWGAEEATQQLDEPLTGRMLLDLLAVADVPPPDFRPAERYWQGRLYEGAADYRTWSRSEGMPRLPFLPRPPDERIDPTYPDDPDNPDDPGGRGPRGFTPRG